VLSVGMILNAWFGCRETPSVPLQAKRRPAPFRQIFAPPTPCAPLTSVITARSTIRLTPAASPSNNSQTPAGVSTCIGSDCLVCRSAAPLAVVLNLIAHCSQVHAGSPIR
jgi:hypothetical protein